MNPEERTKLLETVDGFSTAMLTTVSPEGVIHSRPMTVASREDNVLWFATLRETDAVHEVRAFRSANASLQATLVYVSLSGPASVVEDRAKVESLWKESWSAWFPEGPSDPDIVLIRLEARSADIWDMRGTQGLRTAMKAFTNLVSRQLDKAGSNAQSHVTL